MKPPTIKQAEMICKANGARGVIIITFDKDSFAGSSYGETKRECGIIGKVLDRIIDDMEEGGAPRL